MQFKDDGVHVRGLLLGQLEVELAWVRVEGNQAQTVGQDFVRDDRSVVDDKDVLDGHRGDLTDGHPPDRVGNRTVQTHKVKLHEILSQLLNVKGDLLPKHSVLIQQLQHQIPGYLVELVQGEGSR